MTEDAINIFVLDDDETVLRLVERSIKKIGVTDYKLFSSEDKLMEDVTEKGHVYVIDHKLGAQTGLDIVRAIRQKTNQAFIIIYTGYQDHKVTVNYINAKIDGWVDKNEHSHLEHLNKLIIEGVEIAKKRIDFSAFINKERQKHEQ